MQASEGSHSGCPQAEALACHCLKYDHLEIRLISSSCLMYNVLVSASDHSGIHNVRSVYILA